MLFPQRWPSITFNADPDLAIHNNADPDTTFHVNADPDADPAPHQSVDNLRQLVYGSILSPPRLHWWASTALHGFNLSLYSSWIYASTAPEFKPLQLLNLSLYRLQLLNFQCDADPDPDFHSNANPDLDPTSQNNGVSDPDRQACLKSSLKF